MAFWVFQIGTDLTTASASAVQLINPGGNLGSDVGVFWVVGTSGTAGLVRDARHHHGVRRQYPRADEHHPDHRSNHL